jgi:uncharacterized protein (DUF1501 family)
MPITRRRFLRQVNCAAISAIPILNTLLNLKLAGSVAAATADGSDYRALVCIFLSGGCDTFNVLVPSGDSEYADYATIRGPVALAQSSLLPLNAPGLNGLQLGLNPGLPNIQALFNAGNAAYVTNVGTLIQPVTLDEYNNGTIALPLGLYSHSDQQEQWQTSTPDIRSARGWGGRAADLLQSLNSLNTVSMNISLTGQNIWQSGQNSFVYTVNNTGAVPLQGYDPTNTNQWDPTPIRTQAVNSQLALQYQDLLSQAFNSSKNEAMAAYSLFNSATSTPLPSSVTFPANSYFAQNLQMVAQAIAGHTAMGHARQTFFIEYDGWDTHDNLISTQASLLPDVDASLKAFYDCLAALGLQNNVTVFTVSDFARTLTSDGGGTDHAWGGNHLVLGGAVNGGQIYGQYPPLYANNPLDVGRGRLIPQISVDSYFAEMALWLGVSPSNLPLVLPNIGNFYDVTSGSPPVGFLA